MTKKVSSRIGGAMSAATTQSPTPDGPPPEASPQPVPSLDELYEMTSEPDCRVVIRGVGWSFYEQLVDAIPEGANLHVDYDGKDLEIMSLSPIHNVVKKTLARVVELTAEEADYHRAIERGWGLPGCRHERILAGPCR
jgi:hypothetical protein